MLSNFPKVTSTRSLVSGTQVLKMLGNFPKVTPTPSLVGGAEAQGRFNLCFSVLEQLTFTEL